MSRGEREEGPFAQVGALGLSLSFPFRKSKGSIPPSPRFILEMEYFSRVGERGERFHALPFPPPPLPHPKRCGDSKTIFPWKEEEVGKGKRRGGGGGNHRHLHEKSFPGEGGRARGFFLLLFSRAGGDGFKWTERDRIEWGGGRRTLLLGFLVAGAGGENSCKVRELILSHQFYFCSDVREVFFC